MKKYKFIVLSLFLTVLYGCQSGNDSPTLLPPENDSPSAEKELVYYNESVHLFSDQVYDVLLQVLWQAEDVKFIRSVTIQNAHKNHEFHDVDELLNYRFVTEDWMKPGDYRDQYTLSLSYLVKGENKNLNVDLFLYNAQAMTYQQLFSKVMDEMYFLPDDPADMTEKDRYFFEHKKWNKPTALCWDGSVEQCSGLLRYSFTTYSEDEKNREEARKVVAANFAMHKYAVHTRYYAESIACINGENREPCKATGNGTFYDYHTNFFSKVDPHQQVPYVKDVTARLSDSSAIDRLSSKSNLIEALLRVRNIHWTYYVRVFGSALEGSVPLRPFMPLDESLTAQWTPSHPQGERHNGSFGAPMSPKPGTLLGDFSAPAFQHEMMHSLGFTHLDENGDDRQKSGDWSDDFAKQGQIRSMDLYTSLYRTIAQRMEEGALTVPVNDDLYGVAFY